MNIYLVMEENRIRELEAKEESRKAKYRNMEEQHKIELHEMLQTEVKLQ